MKPLLQLWPRKKKFFETFFLNTLRGIKRDGLLTLAVILAFHFISVSAVGSEVEYAFEAPLAHRSLLLDGCVADDRIVTVGERGHILLSDDYGKSWRQANVPTLATLTSVYFQSGDLGWAVGHDAVILRTEDRGENWSLVYSAPEQERPLLDVLFLDEKNGFAVGAYGFFLVSKDGGLSWAARAISENDFHFNQINVSSNGRLYMAAEAGRIYASDNKGLTWQELSSPYSGSFFGILTLKDQTLLVFGLQGNIFRSQDNGKTWKKIPVPTKSMLTDGLAFENGSVLVVGLSGTVLISENKGKHFRLTQQPDRRGISSVLLAKDGALVLIGESGAKRLSLGHKYTIF